MTKMGFAVPLLAALLTGALGGCTPNREPGNVYRGALIANL